jgi:hypothetical protein
MLVISGITEVIKNPVVLLAILKQPIGGSYATIGNYPGV